jgi:hypothetical protein
MSSRSARQGKTLHAEEISWAVGGGRESKKLFEDLEANLLRLAVFVVFFIALVKIVWDTIAKIVK